jgi:hypothetical protein
VSGARRFIVLPEQGEKRDNEDQTRNEKDDTPNDQKQVAGADTGYDEQHGAGEEQEPADQVEECVSA